MPSPISLRFVIQHDTLTADMTDAFGAIGGIVDSAATKMSSAMTAGFDKIDSRIELMSTNVTGQLGRIVTISEQALERIGALGTISRESGDAAATSFTRAADALERLQSLSTSTRIGSIGGGGFPPVAHGTGPAPEPNGNAVNNARETEAAVSRVGDVAAQAGKRIEAGISEPMKTALGWSRDLESGLVRLYFSLQSLELVGRSLSDLFTKPWTAMIDATEDARRFELAISGVVGGMQQARAVDYAMLSELKDIPLSLAEVRRLTESMSKQGLFTSDFALADPQQAAQQAAEHAKMVAQLSALNPTTSPDQVTELLQQMQGGQLNTRQLRLRLAIDPEDLARMEGVSQKTLSTNPELTMDALKKYLGTFAGGLDQGRGDLVGVSYEKLKDTLSVALQKIGDSGVYDQITSRIKTVTGGIMDYLNGPQFEGRAREISAAVGADFDSLGESALKLLQSLSGSKDLAGTPDAIAQQVGALAKTFADWVKDLPGITAAAGRELRSLAGDIAEFVGAIHSVAHPVEATKIVAGQYSENAQQDRYQSIVSLLDQLGMKGATVDRGQVNRPEFDGYDDSGRPHKTSADDKDMYGAPLWQGGLQVDTAGIKSQVQRLLAEQVFQALGSMDKSSLANADEAKWHLRQSIPNFDERLTDAQASTGPTGTPRYKLPADLQEQVGALGKDQIEPNYATKFHSFDLLADSISSWSGDADKLGAAFKTASLKLRELSGGAGGVDVFDQVAKWRDKTVDQLTDAIAALDAEKDRDPAHAREIGDRIAALSDALTKVTDGYQHEVETLGKTIVEKVGGFGAGLAQNVAKGGDVYAATILQTFADGQTAIQRQAAALLGAHGLPNDVGLNAVPLSQRQTFVGDLAKEKLSAVSTLGKSGVGLDQFQAAGTSASPDAMERMGLGGPLPQNDSLASMLSGRESTSSQNIGIYQQALTQSQGTYTAAQTAMAANPNDEAAQKAFVQAKAAVIQYEAELTNAKQSSNEFFASFIQFGNQAQGAMEKGLGSVFTDLITKTHNMRAAMADMAKAIVNDFSQMASKNLFDFALGQGNGKPGTGNGLGGIIGAILGHPQGGAAGQGVASAAPSANITTAHATATIATMQATSATTTLSAASVVSASMTVTAANVTLISSGGGGSGGGGGGITDGISQMSHSWSPSPGGGGDFGAAGSDFGLGGSGGADFGGAGGGLSGLLSGGGGAAGGDFGSAGSAGLMDALGSAGSAFASGGVVKGGAGQLALIGEGGPGADEAVIPLHGGSVPIGSSGSGYHAVLPGGRSIPAHMFADGGIIPGGIASAAGNSRWSGAAAAGYHGPAASQDSGDIHTHVAVNLDSKTIAQETYVHNRAALKGDMMKHASPGGDLRRALGRT